MFVHSFVPLRRVEISGTVAVLASRHSPYFPDFSTMFHASSATLQAPESQVLRLILGLSAGNPARL